MTATETFDAIVIGAGQAGRPLAADLARAGRRTALIERAHVGGTCVNVGCTPSKTLIASARVAHLARRARDYGVEAGTVRVDAGRVRARKRALVASFRDGGRARLEQTERLALIFGTARFAAPGAVEVLLRDGGTRRLRADTIVIDAGGRPARPAIDGLDAVPALDSTSVMELEVVPEHLLVLGGGPVALEFAQMFRRFGARVTVVQRRPRLLAREDPDVADAVAALLREDGIDLLLATEAVAARDRGGIALRVRGPDGERDLRGSHLLVATGRTPNSDALDLPAAGVQVDERGFIRVDERLATTAPGVFAAGDIRGGPAFTHVAYDDYRVLRDHLLGDGAATTRDRLIPWTVFIDPELARVGLSEREARAAGRAVRVARLPMSRVARALETDEPRGFMKAVVDVGSERILGFTVLGVHGGELLAAVQVAMLGGVRYPVLRDAIFVHPTLAESLNNLFASLDDA